MSGPVVIIVIIVINPPPPPPPPKNPNRGQAPGVAQVSVADLLRQAADALDGQLADVSIQVPE